MATPHMPTGTINFFLKRSFRPLFCILITLLSACCQREITWHLEKIKTSQKCHNFSQLYYVSPDPFCPLQLEILGNSSEFRLFINLLSTGYLEGESVTVKFITENETQIFLASIYTGGQKVFLPPTASEFVINALLQGYTLNVELEGYRALILPSNFAKNFSAGFSRQKFSF